MKSKNASKCVWIGPKHNLVHFKYLWGCLLIDAGKDCNGNPISTFPPCYAFQMIFTALHSGLGLQLTPKKNSKWGRQHYNLGPEMLNLKIMTICRLMSISLCCVLGGAWGVLGWILDVKGGKERSYIISLTLVALGFQNYVKPWGRQICLTIKKFENMVENNFFQSLP